MSDGVSPSSKAGVVRSNRPRGAIWRHLSSCLSVPRSTGRWGVLLATACGDALGAGYEFGPPLPADVPIRMDGGGMWEPEE